jgi:acyl-phosphate glycerol 3-phosphate acyltransferase
MLLLVLLFLASYLLGAVPFGWLIARACGIDILAHGSGNIGATNVGRVLGKKFGILVFVLDFSKGAVPVAAALLLAPLAGDLPREALMVTAGIAPETLGKELRETLVSREALMVTAGIAAFLGHLFPVYLKFRGGKGVATGAGVVAVLVPLPALAAVLTWGVVVVITRYVSVASIAGALMICAIQLNTAENPWVRPQGIVSGFCVAAAGLVVVRHIGNLRRLVNGTENRFKESATMMLISKTLHVVALGLWFGSVVFFTLSGVLMFDEFTKESSKEDRELWFPRPEEFQKEKLEAKFPQALADDLAKEQGSRAFGVVVRPLFASYYGIQLVCGFITYGTALSWQKGREKDKVQRWRTWLLLVALIVTMAGWVLEARVTERRDLRNKKTDEILTAKEPTKEQIKEAEDARAEFFRWHTYSLIQNFATLVLVCIAMALAAQLPAETVEAPSPQVTTAAVAEKKPSFT